jgi:formylmethanofuran dehydrogenase subunit E
MKNKTIKDTEKKTETTPIAKSPHNICDGCGETIRPDQWSENNFILCIDCG